MARNYGGKEANLRQCVSDMQRYADEVSGLADRFEREAEDARNLLLEPLPGIDAEEAKASFREATKLIAVECEPTGAAYEFVPMTGEGKATLFVYTGSTLHAFIERFGTAYGSVPPGLTTVKTVWGDPAGCSKKTRQAVLRGIFSAIDKAFESSEEMDAIHLKQARLEMTRWIEGHFMTEGRILDREREAIRRLEGINETIYLLVHFADEKMTASVSDYARFEQSRHAEAYDPLTDL